MRKGPTGLLLSSLWSTRQNPVVGAIVPMEAQDGKFKFLPPLHLPSRLNRQRMLKLCLPSLHLTYFSDNKGFIIYSLVVQRTRWWWRLRMGNWFSSPLQLHSRLHLQCRLKLCLPLLHLRYFSESEVQLILYSLLVRQTSWWQKSRQLRQESVFANVR